MSAADASTSPSKLDPTRASAFAPVSNREIDPLLVAPIRGEKETGWICS